MSEYTLYACIGSGNCFKPWLALQHLGKSYDLRLIDVLSGEQKSEKYLAVNPLGVVPYLITPNGAPIGESGAMLWHICEGTDLMPDNAEKRAEALQWMFYEQSKLEPFISPARFFTTILPDMAKEKELDVEIWQGKAREGLAYLNTHLSDKTFMLGNTYSLCDIAVFGYVHVIDEAGIDMSDFPAIAHWTTAVSQTDGFVALSEMGTPLLRKSA